MRPIAPSTPKLVARKECRPPVGSVSYCADLVDSDGYAIFPAFPPVEEMLFIGVKATAESESV